MLRIKRRHHEEKPVDCNNEKVVPAHHVYRKPMHSNEDPAQSSISK